MIAVRLEGRLGNQLFQYAFIYATAKKLNTKFYLDKSIDIFLLPRYFEIKEGFPAGLDKSVFSIRGFRNIFNLNMRKGFYKFLGNIFFGNKITNISNESPVSDSLKILKDNVLYKGYFQSVDYFREYENEIRELFSIKKEYADSFNKIYAGLKKAAKTAVIHVRRGDYVGYDMSLPVAYYKEAIARIGTSDIQYIFISDDPNFIENEFGYITDKYISTHSEIIDLQFLANADLCVLSSSSFSWWGAWLNTNPGKKVFAPKNWLGFKKNCEFPVGISNHLDFNWIPV